MRTISIKKSVQWVMDNQDSIKRVGRNVRVIFNVTRYGSKALSKINPVTVYLDAVVSVSEAITAYFNYRKAVERTKQLALELEACMTEFLNLKAEYEERLKTEKTKLDIHTQMIKAEIDIRMENHDVLKHIYEQSGRYLEFIQRIIAEQKRNYMYEDELRNLEKKYVEAIHARIEITMRILGG
ncbi:MAG TPA: hypothetical protein PKW07_10915 [Syntrophorhabdaceae bacterium]|nr:hypothetical protein [Syntrophorhabdaceae bacterium]